MGVYIERINFHRHGFRHFQLYPDGSVEVSNRSGVVVKVMDAVTFIPEPHGRLIDADALRETIVPMVGMWDGDTFWISYDAVLRIIDNASTIIEGSDE